MKDINSIKVENGLYKKKYNKTGIYIIYPFITFLVIFLLFIFFGEKEVSIEVPSSINTYGPTLQVQSQVDGIIDKVNVDNGEYVSAGDIIIEVNSQQIKKEIGNNNEELEGLYIDLDNIKSFEKSVNEGINYIPEDVYEYQNKYSNYIIQIENLSLKSQVLDNQTSNLLYDSTDENFNQGELEEYRLQKKINDNAKLELKHQLMVEIQELKNNINKEIEEKKNTINDFKSQLSQSVIKANNNGYIQFENQFAEGMHVVSGDQLFSVTDTDVSNFYIQGLVSTDKISQLKEGQVANFVIQDGANKKRNIIKSELVNISKIPISTEEGSYYTIESSILNKDNLILGMSGTLNIIYEKVTYFDYYWDKFF